MSLKFHVIRYTINYWASKPRAILYMLCSGFSAMRGITCFELAIYLHVKIVLYDGESVVSPEK